MGWDYEDYYQICKGCGLNYVYQTERSHDSVMYSTYDYFECPRCGEALKLKQYKAILTKVQVELTELEAIGATLYNQQVYKEREAIIQEKLIRKEYLDQGFKLIGKLRSTFEKMSENMVEKHLLSYSQDMRGKNESVYTIRSCYQSKIDFKRERVYNALVEAKLYSDSFSKFKKEFKGKTGVDIYLGFYGITPEQFTQYKDARRHYGMSDFQRSMIEQRNNKMPKTYEEKYEDLLKKLEVAKQKYEISLELYNKYYVR